MASIPLAAAYLVLPLAAALFQWTTTGPGMSPFLPWLVLAGLGTVWAMLFRRSGVRTKKRFVFEALVFLALAALLFRKQDLLLYQMELILPLAVEAAPVAVIGFCLMWASTFGVPDRAAFQRYGATLGLLCAVDLIVEIALFKAVPPLRLLGNTDILAGLLLVALCAGLRPGQNETGNVEPDQGRPAWRFLILLGLGACLSTPGLFGAGWIYLFFGRGSRTKRALTALTFFLLMIATFLPPLFQPDGKHYVDYWIWTKSVALFLREPGVLLTGLPANLALPFAIPPELARVWEQITGSPELLGVQLTQIGPFWLRIVLAWGALIPLACLVGLFILLSRRMTFMGVGLTAALFAMGMSTPLFHDPDLGAAFALAFILALTAPAPGPGAAVRNAAPDADEDPVRQWDLRPL